MTRREFGSIVFKLLGAYFIVAAVYGFLSSASYLLNALRRTPDDPVHVAWFLASVLLAVAVQVVFGVVLVLVSDMLAGRLFGESADKKFIRGVEPQDLSALGFALLGLWFAIAGLAGTVGLVIQTVLAFREEATRAHFFVRNWQRYGSHGVQIVAGFALFWGANGLSGLWRAARAFGRPQPKDETEGGKE